MADVLLTSKGYCLHAALSPVCFFSCRANSASSYVYEVKGVIFDRVHLGDVYLGTVTHLHRHEKNFSFLLLLLAGPAVQVFHKVTVILGSVPPHGTASEPRKRVLESP